MFNISQDVRNYVGFFVTYDDRQPSDDFIQDRKKTI